MGDMNGRTGQRSNCQVVGKYGEDALNENGERLINTCSQYNLRIMNGFFQHKAIYKFTWHQETKGLKSIIDYILLRRDTK